MLKERIEAMKESEKEAHRLMVLPQAQAYNNAIDDAAKLAQEADELMAEMAEAMRGLLSWCEPIAGDAQFDSESEHEEITTGEANKALRKYNQYKERTNDPIPDH